MDAVFFKKHTNKTFAIECAVIVICQFSLHTIGNCQFYL